MSFRYRLPYSVKLGPEQHSFFRYPPVPIRPLGSLPPSQPTTFDTVLKWGFWIGVGFAAVQVFQKLTQKPSWEMNARLTKEELEVLKDLALELYVPGEPISPLAKELGVPVETVIRWMKKVGVYEPAPREKWGKVGPVRDEKLYQKVLQRYVPGESASAQARELGVPLNTLVRWMKKAGVYEPAGRSPAEMEALKAQALEMYVPGESISPLARDLGVSVPTIIRWTEEAGIYDPWKGGTLDVQNYKRALALYVPGEPVGPLAAYLGVQTDTVIKWLKDAGVYVSARTSPLLIPYLDEQKREAIFEAYTPGANLSEIARDVGVSREIAERWLREAGIYIPAPMGGVRGPMGIPPEEKYRMLLDKYEPGMDVIYLAKEIGISHKKAHELLKAEGVYESRFKGATTAEKRKALFDAYTPATSLNELAREIGIPRATAAKWIREAGFYIPAPMGGVRGVRDVEKKREALRRYVPGFPVGQLAEDLEVDKVTIMRWAKEAGIYEPAPVGGPRIDVQEKQLHQEALSRYIPGESVKHLAQDLGISSSTLIAWLKEAGVYEAHLRTPVRDEKYQEAMRRYVPGEPIAPLARELGISSSSLTRWAKEAGVYIPAPTGGTQKGKRWSFYQRKQLVQEALDRYIPGEPVTPLARELGVSVATIIRWLKEAGVYVPVPREQRKKR